MALEVETAEPLREVYRDGVAAGVFLDIDARLVAHNMLLTAHGWALKHWNLSGWLTLNQYIDQELALLLASVRVNAPSGPAPNGRAERLAPNSDLDRAPGPKTGRCLTAPLEPVSAAT